MNAIISLIKSYIPPYKIKYETTLKNVLLLRKIIVETFFVLMKKQRKYNGKRRTQHHERCEHGNGKSDEGGEAPTATGHAEVQDGARNEVTLMPREINCLL